MDMQSAPVTKKQRTYDILAVRPTSVGELAKTLSVSSRAARSLVSDLKQAGVNVHPVGHLDQRRYWVKPSGKPVSLKIPRPEGRKRAPISFTHAQAKELIIETLKSLGGSAPSSTAMTRIERKVGKRLTDSDKLHTYSSRAARWKLRFYAARQGLLKDGVMKRNSPRGYWELTARYRR